MTKHNESVPQQDKGPPRSDQSRAAAIRAKYSICEKSQTDGSAVLQDAIARALKQHGSQKKWAEHLGVTASFVGYVIKGQRAPGNKILADLGLEAVVSYRDTSAPAHPAAQEHQCEFNRVKGGHCIICGSVDPAMKAEQDAKDEYHRAVDELNRMSDSALCASPAQHVAQEPVAWLAEWSWGGSAFRRICETEPVRQGYDETIVDWRITPLYAHPDALAPVEAGFEQRATDLIEGDLTGREWKLACQEFAKDVRAALRAQSAPVGGLSQAALDVLAERQRQISAEGWTREHDDGHSFGDLAAAGAAYLFSAATADRFLAVDPLGFWPWEKEWFKPSPGDPRRDLVKGLALGLAQLESLDRAAPVGGEGGDA